MVLASTQWGIPEVHITKNYGFCFKKYCYKGAELILDCQYVTSKYLINTIEFSYNAWTKVPKNKRASFEDFCNYILPYKNGSEPIEEDSRMKLAKKYTWVSDLLNKGTPLSIVVDSVSSVYNFENVMEVRDYYPQPLSISQLEKTKFGLCDYGVNYLLNVFRSLGIVSARDAMLHWGNHPCRGHSWLYVKYGNEEYSTDVREK